MCSPLDSFPADIFTFKLENNIPSNTTKELTNNYQYVDDIFLPKKR